MQPQNKLQIIPLAHNSFDQNSGVWVLIPKNEIRITQYLCDISTIFIKSVLMQITMIDTFLRNDHFICRDIR